MYYGLDIEEEEQFEWVGVGVGVVGVGGGVEGWGEGSQLGHQVDEEMVQDGEEDNLILYHTTTTAQKHLKGLPNEIFKFSTSSLSIILTYLGH